MNDAECAQVFVSTDSFGSRWAPPMHFTSMWQFPMPTTDASNTAPPSLGSFWAEAVAKRVTQPLVRSTQPLALPLPACPCPPGCLLQLLNCQGWSMARRYDSRTTTFSPEGRLYQASCSSEFGARVWESKSPGRICHGSYQLSGFDRRRPCRGRRVSSLPATRDSP